MGSIGEPQVYERASYSGLSSNEAWWRDAMIGAEDERAGSIVTRRISFLVVMRGVYLNASLILFGSSIASGFGSISSLGMSFDSIVEVLPVSSFLELLKTFRSLVEKRDLLSPA